MTGRNALHFSVELAAQIGSKIEKNRAKYRTKRKILPSPPFYREHPTIRDLPKMAGGELSVKSTSSAINAGTVIPGITDGYLGLSAGRRGLRVRRHSVDCGGQFQDVALQQPSCRALTAAASVTANNVLTTAGSLVAGKTGTGSSTNNRSFLMFDLSGVAVSKKIQSAVLRIYENTAPISRPAA